MSYAHNLGQNMLEIYSVPKEKDVVQKMMQTRIWHNPPLDS